MFKIPPGKVIAFDTETTGLYWRKGARPYCFSFCNEKGDTAVISFPVNPKTRQVKYDQSLDLIRKFFEDTSVSKVAHNAQFDVGMIESLGIRIRGAVICTMNLIRLVVSNEPLALKKFCEKNLGIGVEDETALKEAVRQARREGKAKGYALYRGDATDDGSLAPDYWLAPRSLVEKYALTDAVRCMAIFTTLIPEIRIKGMERLWKQEQMTWSILRKIEKRGIHIFPEKIRKQIEDLKKKLLKFQNQAYQIVGNQINFNSSLQLRAVFYEKLKELPRFLTKSGLPSTDADSLRSMQHPLSKIILNIRACVKTAEFMNQYLFFMKKHRDGDYYIHPSFHQASTVTGRESCRSPNLQQVASGRNDKGIEVLVEARSVFGPRKGYQMRSYDWKNIEVFIPAFASGEEKLINVLKEGGDVHQNTAISLSRLCEQPLSRDSAKRIFFGLLYGIGAKKLAKMLGLEKKLGAYIVHEFKKEYSTLARWMETLKYDAATKGFITTAYGRVIYISSEENYKAPNYYVQGTAAGILRNAKIKIFKLFREWKEWDCHIVLPIHDELLIEIPEKTDSELIDFKVVRCMQDNPELNMPLPIPVSISCIGEHWADKKKIKIL